MIKLNRYGTFDDKDLTKIVIAKYGMAFIIKYVKFNSKYFYAVDYKLEHVAFGCVIDTNSDRVNDCDEAIFCCYAWILRIIKELSWSDRITYKERAFFKYVIQHIKEYRSSRNADKDKVERYCV